VSAHASDGHAIHPACRVRLWCGMAVATKQLRQT